MCADTRSKKFWVENALKTSFCLEHFDKYYIEIYCLPFCRTISHWKNRYLVSKQNIIDSCQVLQTKKHFILKQSGIYLMEANSLKLFKIIATLRQCWKSSENEMPMITKRLFFKDFNYRLNIFVEQAFSKWQTPSQNIFKDGLWIFNAYHLPKLKAITLTYLLK